MQKKGGKKESHTPKDGKNDKKIEKIDKAHASPRKKKDLNNVSMDFELTTSEEKIIASFHLPLESILDCSSYKVESTFTKKLNIPEYVIKEFEAADGQLTNKSKEKQKERKSVLEVKKKPGKYDQLILKQIKFIIHPNFC